MNKHAKADITPIRQRTQFSCMAASATMALGALGIETDEDEVNKVMGCKPMQGATWEQAIACFQHWGMRTTLVTPCTLGQLKAWTDRGVPVLIAWNPEGRDWSHASCVFDVDADENVYVADPNCPDPEQTVRVVPKAEFYGKWSEKWPNYLVRRPALAVEREITPDGRQVMASRRVVTDLERAWFSRR
jgi:ABC-type bacteriocin/lantibiotic exporter with double-glycine peptidase domain